MQYLKNKSKVRTYNKMSKLSKKLKESEKREKLEQLKNDPDAHLDDVKRAEQDLKYLDSLYENFDQGMNVFRTAKGGRAKLRD